MTPQPTTFKQRICSIGQPVAMTGGVLALAAIIIGFVGMIGMIMFGDPEDPHKLYGKVSSGVCILFCAGLLLGLVGFLLSLGQPKEQDPQASKTPRKRS